MAIIPLREKGWIMARCPICFKDYLRQLNPDTQVSCTVNHPEGSCCHFAEERLILPEHEILIKMYMEQEYPETEQVLSDD